jgi:hypothetical protein
MRDARQEASDRLAGRYETRVLEPSPPAVGEGPWFADDPTARGHVPAGRQVVSPVTTGDVLWDELARDNNSLTDWCAERWLGTYRRLEPAPPGLTAARDCLHALAERVMKPARERANGKIGLRYTRGGFGTPFFGEDVQVRVEDAQLMVDDRSGERRAPLTTLAAAAEHVGVPLEGEDAELEVDEQTARFLGDWYGFGASILEQLRAEAAAGLEPSRVQLWPEHFDIATELGGEQAGARAGYGCSPGDEDHAEPYVYVVPWTQERARGELWNATAFRGAELSYAELLDAPDQRAAALDFFRARLAALTG